MRLTRGGATPPSRPVSEYGAWSMRVEEIGELTERPESWRLVYDACGHIQYLSRSGLEDPRRAEESVRRYYTACLICKAEARLRLIVDC